MTALGTAWDQLGLEATDDARAIRRAYARRLKTIDVDADPAAFIVLRDALAWALAQAAAAPHVEPIVEGGHDTPPPSLEPAPRPVAVEKPRPEIQFSGADIDPANPAKLNELLFGDGDARADTDQILKLTQTILAQAANARIDKVAYIEAWLAATIANAIPRSDVMIDPVVEHFYWAAGAADWPRSPAIDAILNRRRDLHFLAEVSEPDHRLSPAYLALKSKPRFRAVFNRKLRDNVETLLVAIRRNYPGTISHFDAKVLEWWSPKRVRQRRNTTIAVFVVGLICLARLASLFHLGPPSIVSQVLPDQLVVGDDVCPWRSGVNGVEILFCRDAKGQLVGAAPSAVSPDVIAAAKAGNADAMVAVGRFHAASPSIATDGQAAAAWFRKAADLGNPEGMLDLGLLNGTYGGVQGDGPNMAEAARWYQAAAGKGLPQAKYMLGCLYVRGGVLQKDDARAVALFREAADDGWAPAKSALGLMYERGLGVPADQAEALALYGEAARNGDPVGSYLLAENYMRKMENSDPLDQDPSAGTDPGTANSPQMRAQTAGLLHAAMDKGMVDAMPALAVLYHKGEGVDANDRYAFLLLQTAAGEGKVTAMYDLGVAYLTGIGVKKNDAEAAKWFRAAADAGAPAAIQQLKAMHLHR
jgi:TPR repeat protein